MKSILHIAFLLVAIATYAQRDFIYGSVVDSDRFPMSDVYIRNINAGIITSTDTEGDFRIPAQVGDTIVVSFVGFNTITKVVSQDWITEKKKIFKLLPETTILNEVIVTSFPEYNIFKQHILEKEAEKKAFQTYGVPKVVITEEDRLNAALAVTGPFSALNKAFGKKAKEQKKLRSLLQTQETREKATSKFSRDWVAEFTELEGDKLTSFIAYCNFSDSYIANTPEYIIQEKMMALLPKFLESYTRQG